MCNSLFRMNSGRLHQLWDPCKNLFAKYKDENYAVILLNTDFKLPRDFLLNLWTQAKIRITVDGGTEKWLLWLKEQSLDFKKINPPDFITGDMDSLSQSTLAYFTSTGISKVVETPDQNETDFTKALRELSKTITSENIQLDSVYVVADTCGRLDQILGNINTLYKAPKIFNDVKVYQVASNSITWLLARGTHTVHIPLELRQRKEWCALVPLKSPTIASSTGLKWNLNNSKLEFGGLISSSNTYDCVSSKVTICTDNMLVWSMGIETLLSQD